MNQLDSVALDIFASGYLSALKAIEQALKTDCDITPQLIERLRGVVAEVAADRVVKWAKGGAA